MEPSDKTVCPTWACNSSKFRKKCSAQLLLRCFCGRMPYWACGPAKLTSKVSAAQTGDVSLTKIALVWKSTKNNPCAKFEGACTFSFRENDENVQKGLQIGLRSYLERLLVMSASPYLHQSERTLKITSVQNLKGLARLVLEKMTKTSKKYVERGLRRPSKLTGALSGDASFTKLAPAWKSIQNSPCTKS